MNLELRVTIGDLAETIRGVTYEKAEARDSPHQGYSPLIRATNIDHGALVLDSFVYVPDVVVRDDQRLRVGDIVLAASSGSLSIVGKAALLRSQWQGTFGAFCYAVRPDPERVVPDYLAYFMQTSAYRSRVSKLAAGVNINNLRREHIESVELPYCALTEQQRIVEAIDSYLTRLDDAVASLERVQTKLKAYRASVLKAAVEGHLVPTEASLALVEKRDFEPAEALLARTVKERRRRGEEAELAKLKAAGKTPKADKPRRKEPTVRNLPGYPALPTGWCWVRLGDVASLLNGDRGKNYPSKAAYVEAGVPFITAGNLRDDAVDKSSLNFISEQRYGQLRAGHIQEDDILYCLRGSLGKSAIVRGLSKGAIASSLLIIRLPRLIGPSYLYIALASPWGQQLISQSDNGTAQPNLSAKSVADYALPMPPFNEMERISAEVQRLLSLTDSLDREVVVEIRRLSRLRQAILKWAFEGKLADQDPNDEPGEKLLALLRAERAPVGPAKQRQGRKARGAA